MSWSRTAIALLILAAWAGPTSAQVRVRPRSAEGGEAQGEPWAEVPEAYRRMTLPDWPVPTDLGRWKNVDRPRTRTLLLKLLGEMPPRPDPAKVEVAAREEHDGYTLERFRFHNGVDAVVPGILLLPKGRKGPAPAVVGLHGHGSSKESVCSTEGHGQYVGPALARRGYVVAAIDAYFNGERVGQGPAGRLDDAQGPEASLFKLDLWLGRTLWGMRLRDEQCLLDYLQTRPEVDGGRIGARG